MKIVRFATDSKVKYGILEGKSVQTIEDKPYRYIKLSDQCYKLSAVNLLSPCTPSKIVALGLNYHSHVEEVKATRPKAPLMDAKHQHGERGHEATITYPPTSQRVEYEGDLGEVIKIPLWRVSVQDALDYVLGYTCFNDVTARELQYHDRQWTRAKGFDTFAAVGPCIETELDLRDVVLKTYLNGELKQQGNTSDLIYSVPELINFISHVMSLLPGDIIATGTPSSIGPMYPGDTVEIKIGPIGTLRNSVVRDG